tara:strand:+ start:489 stop:1049 length:561 start_codon:yes stop_codon:yes gene_type:complete
MAIRTVTVGSGSGADYEPGWKELTIRQAKYGTYKGTKFIDIWFEGYPDNKNARAYETINKTTNEEFRISNWFMFANAGIQEVIDNDSKKPVITYDDDPANLNGMTINVLFYKDSRGDGKYSDIWREPAPVVMDTDKLSYTEENVAFWKSRAERGLNTFQSRNGESPSSIETVIKSITDPPTTEVPF